MKTKKDTVNLALKEFVNKRKQLEITSIFGKGTTCTILIPVETQEYGVDKGVGND